jgi:hypothetical protein
VCVAALKLRREQQNADRERPGTPGSQRAPDLRWS